MFPQTEHSFYAWLIIIGSVCLAIIIAAAIDRVLINRRLKILAQRMPETHAFKNNPDFLERNLRR